VELTDPDAFHDLKKKPNQSNKKTVMGYIYSTFFFGSEKTAKQMCYTSLQ